MANKPLPEKFRRYYNEDTVEELWEKYLNEGNIRLRRNRPFHGKIPANPRCVNCLRPFGGIGGFYYRIFQGLQKSDKNPRYCSGCHSFIHEIPGGAEVELTMLFVDVRGSTTIAETMDAFEFSRLMNRFYEVAIKVLVRSNAFIDKLVGDEVTALFIPGFTGEDHARIAVDAGKGLLETTGHGK
ncbi:MAG: adenylate/guanylate cyclase domain-containing protein, partial [Anaerolineales bacterium]